MRKKRAAAAKAAALDMGDAPASPAVTPGGSARPVHETHTSKALSHVTDMSLVASLRRRANSPRQEPLAVHEVQGYADATRSTLHSESLCDSSGAIQPRAPPCPADSLRTVSPRCCCCGAHCDLAGAKASRAVSTRRSQDSKSMCQRAALPASWNVAMRKQSLQNIPHLLPASFESAAQPSPPLSGALPPDAILSGALPSSSQGVDSATLLAGVEEQIVALAAQGPLRGVYKLLGPGYRQRGSAIPQHACSTHLQFRPDLHSAVVYESRSEPIWVREPQERGVWRRRSWRRAVCHRHRRQNVRLHVLHEPRRLRARAEASELAAARGRGAACSACEW